MEDFKEFFYSSEKNYKEKYQKGNSLIPSKKYNGYSTVFKKNLLFLDYSKETIGCETKNFMSFYSFEFKDPFKSLSEFTSDYGFFKENSDFHKFVLSVASKTQIKHLNTHYDSFAESNFVRGFNVTFKQIFLEIRESDMSDYEEVILSLKKALDKGVKRFKYNFRDLELEIFLTRDLKNLFERDYFFNRKEHTKKRSNGYSIGYLFENQNDIEKLFEKVKEVASNIEKYKEQPIKKRKRRTKKEMEEARALEQENNLKSQANILNPEEIDYTELEFEDVTSEMFTHLIENTKYKIFAETSGDIKKAFESYKKYLNTTKERKAES